MVSAYKEGGLLRGALDSLQAVECDRIYVYEGPAGDPLEAIVPASELPDWWVADDPRCAFHAGRWRTDARKRNEMLQQAKRDYPGVTWAVIVDGDEVLVNGGYLRDRLQALLWDDEAKGARAGDVDNPPWARWPLHLVEHDGSISIITARVVRIDLLRSIDVSSSVVTNEHGVREGWGNYEARSAVWIEGWLHAIDHGKMIAWPPLPCEPHIVHRSNLRHPLRRGLRMSEQEAEEFARVQAEEAEANGRRAAAD
jgi:hypothetical protein